MTTTSSNQMPVLLYPEPNEQTEHTKTWERLPGESAKWHWRFRNYLSLGPKRSINAVYESEQQAKAERSRGRAGETWYNAAKKYQWAQRADAFDKEQDEQKAVVMRQIAARCSYVSRPFRIVELNIMVDALARQLEKGHQDATTFIALSKQIQSLLQDIKTEMQEWNVPIDASCDASALDAFNSKQERLKEAAEERELDEEYELDRKIEAMQQCGMI